MTLILKLCKYILIPIISEWLSAFELIDLDTSLCNKKERWVLYELIREFPGKFALVLGEVAVLSSKFKVWCESRGICDSYGLNWKLQITVRSLSEAISKNSLSDDRYIHFLNGSFSFDFVNASQKNISAILTVLSQTVNAVSIEFSGFSSLNKASVSAVVSAVATHCPRLRTLVLPERSSDEDYCSVSAMQQLFQGCPRLSIASISCRSFDMARLAAGLVVNCKEVCEVAMHCSDAMPRTAVAMLSLTRNTSARLTTFTGRPMSDKTLLALMWYRGPSLTSLNIANSYEITDVSVSVLGQACPVLRYISLSECHRVSDAGINALAVSPLRATLESINLGGLINLHSGVLAVGTHCTRLTGLELRRHRLLDLSTLAAPPFAGLRRLSILFLGIDDTGLTSVAQRCSLLEELVISHNPMVSDISVVRVAELCRHLRVLSMKTLAKVTDVSLFALAEHCPQLIDLGLTGCGISDEGVIRVAERCHKMERMVLHLLPRVTIASLAALAENCSYLRALCFSSKLVGDRHNEFGVLLRRMRRLQSISVGPAMPDDSLYADLARVVVETNPSIAFVSSNEFHLTSMK